MTGTNDRYMYWLTITSTPDRPWGRVFNRGLISVDDPEVLESSEEFNDRYDEILVTCCENEANRRYEIAVAQSVGILHPFMGTV
jgi:hypothetical protein